MTTQNLLGDLNLEATQALVRAAVETLATRAQESVASGNIIALNGYVELAVNGRNTVAFQVTGTWVATLSVQGTVDGTNWITLTGNQLINVGTDILAASITTTNFLGRANVAGFSKVRVTATAFTSGTAAVTMRASDTDNLVTLNSALPTGGNVLGSVAVTSLGAITPGTAAANLGKLEDNAHTTGDVGTFALSVRNDNAATTPASANGDYQQVSTDEKGTTFTRVSPTANASTITAKTMVASTNQTMLAANAARRFASISNGLAAALLVKLGATATTSSYTVSIAAGGYYEVPSVYTGIIDAISTAAGSVLVTEM